jgi:hypothetical protein
LAAVDEAIREALGSTLSGMLEMVARDDERLLTVMSDTQSRLFWLQRNAPVTAEKVLRLARQRLAARV